MKQITGTPGRLTPSRPPVPSELIREAEGAKQLSGYSDCYRWALNETERSEWMRCRSPLLSPLRVFSSGIFIEARGHDWERTGLAEGILIYCTEGKGYYSQDGREVPVQRGDLLYAQPRTHHRYRADAEQPWTIYWMHLSGEMLAEYERLLGLVSRGPVRHIGLHNDVVLEFSRLVTEPIASHPDEQSWFRLQANAIAVLSRIAALPDNIAEIASAYGPIQKAIAIMNASLHQAFDIHRFAQAARLSERHFSRQFRKITGLPPGDWFIQQKIRRALMLLTLPGIQVKQVASRLGYDDPLYFSRVFRRFVGMPPEAYRRKIFGGGESEPTSISISF